MSDTPIDEVLAEMAGGIPLSPMPKTNYADPDTLATLARLERENADLRAELEQVRKDAERSVDPMDNWLMRPALEWLEQAEHGHDNERCKMIAALLRDLWRGPAKATVIGDAAIAQGKGEK